MNMGNRQIIPRVSIIMGSDSDLSCMKSAAKVLEDFEVPYEIKIVSAHRTPKLMVKFAEEAAERGIECIIAGAGGAAHLPGMVASLTPLPVIGVPVLSSALNGNDSLLSIVQMPKGVPVATVAIHNATNAGLLAVRILGAQDTDLRWRMKDYLHKQEFEVMEKSTRLELQGYKQYMSDTVEKKAFKVLHDSEIKKTKPAKTYVKQERNESEMRARDYKKKRGVVDLVGKEKSVQVVEGKDDDDVFWWH
tara:strand:- start:19368 stop:20111 length:744 start_codon:yes stop_codon:yes gene_type:complete